MDFADWAKDMPVPDQEDARRIVRAAKTQNRAWRMLMAEPIAQEHYDRMRGLWIEGKDDELVRAIAEHFPALMASARALLYPENKATAPE